MNEVFQPPKEFVPKPAFDNGAYKDESATLSPEVDPREQPAKVIEPIADLTNGASKIAELPEQDPFTNK